MPYIKKEDRPKDGEPFVPTTAGELNFLITTFCDAFLGANARYSDYNTVIGVLECAKLELYRRRVAKYEDLKCAENGDVYSGVDHD